MAPDSGAKGKLTLLKAARAEQLAPCCAVCLLTMSISDGKYGRNLRGGWGTWGPGDDE